MENLNSLWNWGTARPAAERGRAGTRAAVAAVLWEGAEQCHQNTELAAWAWGESGLTVVLVPEGFAQLSMRRALFPPASLPVLTPSFSVSDFSHLVPPSPIFTVLKWKSLGLNTGFLVEYLLCVCSCFLWGFKKKKKKERKRDILSRNMQSVQG